jgi:hypothetical protein
MDTNIVLMYADSQAEYCKEIELVTCESHHVILLPRQHTSHMR